MTYILGKQYSGLLETLYEAAFDEQKWALFGSQLSAEMGEGVMLLMRGHDARTGTATGAITRNFDPWFLKQYEQYYASINPWMKAVGSVPLGKVNSEHDFLEHAEMIRTEFWSDFLRPMGDISANSGVVLHRDSERFFAIALNFRWKHEYLYREKAAGLLEFLVPHLYKVARIQRALNGHQLINRTYLEVLEGLGNAVFTLNLEGRVLYCNHPAEDLVNNNRAVFFQRNGHLGFTDRPADKVLSEALLAAHINPDGIPDAQVYINLGEGATRAKLNVFPFCLEDSQTGFLTDFGGAGNPVMMLVISNRGDRKNDVCNALQRHFGLSPIEARLAYMLFEGKSLEEAAAARGVSIHTARNQLKSVFSKTDTNRQGQLVALLSKLA